MRDRNTRLCAFLLAIALLGAKGICGQQTTPEAPVVSYHDIMAHLDTGGDLLLVANMEGALERTVGNLSELLDMIPGQDRDTLMIKNAAARAPEFLRQNGFYAFQGFGLSSKPAGDGRTSVKCYLRRDAKAMESPLWRGIVGWNPRSSAALRFLPGDTVVARTSTPDPREIWKLAQSAVKTFGTPPARRSFERSIARFATDWGVEFHQLVASLGDEAFIAIQLSTNSTTTIKTDNGAIRMPTPSLLMGVALTNDILLKTLEAQLIRERVRISDTRVGTTVVRSLEAERGTPIPVQLTYATHAGFLILGTTQTVVLDAISAFEKRNGLVMTDHFQKSFAGLPAENNGIVYMHPGFTKEVSSVLRQIMALNEDSSDGDIIFFRIWLNTLQSQKDPSCAMVIVNEKNGVFIQGTSSAGGRDILMSLGAAPAGILAAIAIPSFVKARETSQRNACINNLRQIDAAKEQAALESRWTNGQFVATGDTTVNSYIRGLDGTTNTPTCHAGGAYTYNPIGSNPACSLAEHVWPIF
jgi:hypothetical protein